MRIMRWGARILERSSPVVLLATGAAIAVAFPPVRRSLRTAAVLTTRGALALSDKVKQLGARIKENTAGIIAEAREFDNQPQTTISETVDCLKDTAKKQGRRVAVATAAGALALSDKAKALRKDFKEVMEEARADLADHKDTDDEDDINDSPPNEGSKKSSPNRHSGHSKSDDQ